MTTRKKRSDTGVMSFSFTVLPTNECLQTAIAADGFCHPSKCWHKVAIEKEMEKLEPGKRHNVRVDAGHIKLNYRGWRYIADTPLHVKRSLMLFDRGQYERVHVREYTLRFRRTTKIVPFTRDRQEQINEARRKRIAAGSLESSTERQRRYNLRARVAGFSGVV